MVTKILHLRSLKKFLDLLWFRLGIYFLIIPLKIFPSDLHKPNIMSSFNI